jgi:hypothetical protein
MKIKAPFIVEAIRPSSRSRIVALWLYGYGLLRPWHPPVTWGYWYQMELPRGQGIGDGL